MQETTRRSFWSTFWAALVGLIMGSSASAASKVDLSQLKVNAAGPGLLGYAGGSAALVAVGSGLNLAGGVLSAPGTTAPQRTRGVILARDAAGNYPLPAGVRLRTSVWRGGMRQAAGLDYAIVSDVVTPVAAYPWEPDATVLVDGE